MNLNHPIRAALISASFAITGAQLAQAQQYSSIKPAITAPSAGAAVASPVTVSYSLGAAGQSPGGADHHMPHAYLVIDAASPAAGSSIQPDADHVAFPAGQFALSVPLAAGHHQLQIIFVNRKGQVSSHIQPSAPVSISVG